MSGPLVSAFFWYTCEMHVHEIHAYEMHDCKIYAHETHAYEVCPYEIHTREIYAHRSVAFSGRYGGAGVETDLSLRLGEIRFLA
jgi:hypothetical protein